jgi:hypothetical protein
MGLCFAAFSACVASQKDSATGAGNGDDPDPADDPGPPGDTGPGEDTGPGDDTGPGEDTGPHSCFDEPVKIDVGTGENTYEPLIEGQPITMVHGPQGGWHILGSVRAHNTDAIITVHFTVTHDDSGVNVVDNTYRVALVPDGECSGYFPGMFGYLEVSGLAEGELDTPPELMGSDSLTMTMDVVDFSGRVGSAQLTVRAQLDPADVEDTGSP